MTPGRHGRGGGGISLGVRGRGLRWGMRRRQGFGWEGAGYWPYNYRNTGYLSSTWVSTCPPGCVMCGQNYNVFGERVCYCDPNCQNIIY
jgi:hypothetical protein